MNDIPSIWDIDPEEHGYELCGHCNGYGSSLKEEAERCTRCGGKGLVKTKEQACLFCKGKDKHMQGCPVIKGGKK